MPVIQSVMDFYQALTVDSDYSDSVVLVVEIEKNQVDAFTQATINKSGAKVVVTTIN